MPVMRALTPTSALPGPFQFVELLSYHFHQSPHRQLEFRRP
jgi:hypothetical protein